jgi:hypothetical protein
MQIEAVSRRRRSAQNRRRNCGGKGYGRNLLMEWTQHGGSESFIASTLPMQKWHKVLFGQNFAKIDKSTLNGSFMSRFTLNN